MVANMKNCGEKILPLSIKRVAMQQELIYLHYAIIWREPSADSITKIMFEYVKSFNVMMVKWNH